MSTHCKSLCKAAESVSQKVETCYKHFIARIANDLKQRNQVINKTRQKQMYKYGTQGKKLKRKELAILEGTNNCNRSDVRELP